MTLVLNTLESGDCSEQIKALLAGIDENIEIVNTADMKIAHCMGCNMCWLKTPGVCAIRDDYEIILKKLVAAENFWIVTDTKFGFVDYRGIGDDQSRESRRGRGECHGHAVVAVRVDDGWIAGDGNALTVP